MSKHTVQRRPPTAEEEAVSAAMAALDGAAPPDTSAPDTSVPASAQPVQATLYPQTAHIPDMFDQLAGEIRRWPLSHVRLHFDAVRMTFKAHVFISADALTLFTWSASGLQMELEVSGERIWDIDIDGMPYRAAFLGSQIQIGLLATVTSFMLLDDKANTESRPG